MGEMLIDPAPPHTRGQSRVNAAYAFLKKKGWKNRLLGQIDRDGQFVAATPVSDEPFICSSILVLPESR